MYKLEKISSYPRSHEYPSRSRDLLNPSFQRLSVIKKSFKYMGPLYWYSVPATIKDFSLFHLFKGKIKKKPVIQSNDSSQLFRIIGYLSHISQNSNIIMDFFYRMVEHFRGASTGTVQLPSLSDFTLFHLATSAMFTVVPQEESIPVVVRLAFFALPVESVFQSDTDTKYS